MKRHSLVAAAALALVAGACGRGSAEKGQPSEQQRADLDEAAKMVESNQVVELPDDSLSVNESEADAALNAAAPANRAASGMTPARPPANSAMRAPVTPQAENGAANPAPR